MRTPSETTRGTWRAAAAAMAALGACGGPPPANNNGPLSGDGPVLIAVNGSVRRVVVTANQAHAQTMTAATCGAQAYLFDTANPRELNGVGQTMGECRLYAATSDLALASQTWICAGAISLSYGTAQENLVACRAPGAPLQSSAPLNCAGLDPGAMVRARSGPNELDGDVLPDLDASVTLPGSVVITQPTALGITTWPAAGDVTVRWTSANATSAVVTLRPRDSADPAPVMICQPGTNGQVTLPAALLVEAGYRMREAILQVASYRDVTVQAEVSMARPMGLPYRLSAGNTAQVLLQPLR